MAERERRYQSPPAERERQAVDLPQQESIVDVREVGVPGGVDIRNIYVEEADSARDALERMEAKFTFDLAECDILSGRSPQTLDEAVARDRVLEVKPELASLRSRTLGRREFVG